MGSGVPTGGRATPVVGAVLLLVPVPQAARASSTGSADIQLSARHLAIPALDEIAEAVQVGLELFGHDPPQDGGIHQRRQHPGQLVTHGQLHGRALWHLGIEENGPFRGKSSDGFPMELLRLHPLGDARLPLEAKALGRQGPVG